MDLHKTYFEICSRIKDLEAQKRRVGALIQKQMEESEQMTDKREYGTFSLTRRSVYEYSKDIEELKHTLWMKKKNYETNNEPKDYKYSLTFRKYANPRISNSCNETE